MSKSKKSPKKVDIYGILDFKKKKLLMVSLSRSDIEFEFDIEGYDDDLFGVVKLSIRF